VEHGEELQYVVKRFLAKDPEERYQTTKDLLADIRRVKRHTESGVRVAPKCRHDREQSGCSSGRWWLARSSSSSSGLARLRTSCLGSAARSR
jgi:hypothetical protein